MIGLQNLIIERKVKTTELAKQIGVGGGTVWDWINKNKIPKKYLEKLAEIFNVEEDYLNEVVNNINTYKPKYSLNKYEKRGKITVIFIVRRDGIVLEVFIDTKNLKRFIDFNKTWHSAYNKHSDHYYILCGQGKERLYLHQWVMEVGTEVYVDHKNYDTLDNRKENLRITTNSNNLKNRKSKNKNNKSGYRNVFWSTKDNAWLVALQVDGKQKYFGRFDYEDVDLAGACAEKARQEIYGEYAGLS